MTRSTARFRVGLLVLAGLTISACGTGGPDPLIVAVRAVAVDLAFADEDKAEPVEPEVIIRIIPAPPEVVSGEVALETFVSPPRTAPVELPTFSFLPDCPVAPPDISPEEPASINVTGKLIPGRYDRHNTGTVRVIGGVIDLTLPYPPFNKEFLTALPPPTPTGAGDLLGGEEPEPEPVDPEAPINDWEVRTEITPDVAVTNTYRNTGSALALVKRVTESQQSVTTFEPNPPIDLIQVNEGVGHTWRSAGVDIERNTAMQVEGKIERREPVDVCGDLVDGFRVTTTETIVDLATGSASGTDEPNVTHWATQLGGLIIRTEQHYTQTQRDPDSGSPVTLEFDFVSIIDSIEPESGS